MSARAASTPCGFKGLRIGKVSAALNSDAGMEYDGMYWHYIDKWIFALVRYSQASNDLTALREAVHLIKAIHRAFLQKSSTGQPLGLHWKLNSDLRPIRELNGAYPNDDALSGYLVYSLVHHASAGHSDIPSIDEECAELREVAGRYVQSGIRISSDPLGFGLWGWKSQWLGHLAEPVRTRLHRLAPTALDISRGMQLPFRLYGALLGAQLASDSSLLAMAEEVLNSPHVVDMTVRAPVEEELACINKVMLASALDPLAFAWIEGEPLLTETELRAERKESQRGKEL
jgi:hypothetical protein